MHKNDGLIPEDDAEFEEQAAKAEREARLASEEEEKRSEEENKKQEEERRQYESELQSKKIELIKLKQGVVDEADSSIQEQKPQTVRLSLGEWIENVWYRSKWLIIFVAVMAVAVGYIIYDTATRQNPDITVLAVSSDSGLYARTVELESFFERYCPDLNGDGEVDVLVYYISTDYSDATMASSYQAQLMTQLQLGDNMIIISDGTTDFEVHDFTGELEGECVTDKGIRLSCPLTKEALKWEAMPDELYIGLREPAKLLSTSHEQMQENYETALPIYTAIYEDIAKSLAENEE